MAKMYVLCGFSGVGKTTFAKDFAEQNGVIHLNIDDFYAQVNGDECDRSNMYVVWRLFFDTIRRYEQNDEDIIIDVNCLTKGQREQFLEWFPSFSHHLIYIQADEDLRYKNNASRYRQVPEDAMQAQVDRFECPSMKEIKMWDSYMRLRNINNQAYHLQWAYPENNYVLL